MGWEEPVVLVLGAPQCPSWAHANAKYKAGTSPFMSALFQLTETTKHTHKKRKKSARSLLGIGSEVAVMGTACPITKQP